MPSFDPHSENAEYIEALYQQYLRDPDWSICLGVWSAGSGCVATWAFKPWCRPIANWAILSPSSTRWDTIARVCRYWNCRNLGFPKKTWTRAWAMPDSWVRWTVRSGVY